MGDNIGINCFADYKWEQEWRVLGMILAHFFSSCLINSKIKWWLLHFIHFLWFWFLYDKYNVTFQMNKIVIHYHKRDVILKHDIFWSETLVLTSCYVVSRVFSLFNFDVSSSFIYLLRWHFLVRWTLLRLIWRKNKEFENDGMFNCICLLK